MPNRIKYNKTGSETNSVFKGDWAVDLRSHGGGPTSTTGIRAGLEIPTGGYAFYGPGEVARTLENDAELLTLVGNMGGDNSSVGVALEWALLNDEILILDNTIEKIVTDGLIMNLDAGALPSYPRNGTIWYDLSGNGNNANKSKGTWNSNGYWDSEYDSGYFDGKDRLRFEIEHSTSLNDTFSTTTGAWVIEEIILINDNTYPEAAAGSVVSNSAYSSGQIGFDWNHGVYNTQIQMGIGNNVGQVSGYDVRQSWTLPTKFQTLNTWYHRSFYWDRANDEMGVYYNGELIGSVDISAVSGLSLYDGGGIKVGELYGWCHDGARASMRVYNRRLTPQEVLQNYNAQKERYGE